MNDDNSATRNPHAQALGRLGGKKRANNLSWEERKESARLAVQARWDRLSPEERTAIAKRSAQKRWAKRKVKAK